MDLPTRALVGHRVGLLPHSLLSNPPPTRAFHLVQCGARCWSAGSSLALFDWPWQCALVCRVSGNGGRSVWSWRSIARARSAAHFSVAQAGRLVRNSLTASRRHDQLSHISNENYVVSSRIRFIDPTMTFAIASRLRCCSS